MGHTQLPPISSLDFAWNQLAHQQGLHPMYNLPMPGQLVPPIPFPNTLHSIQVPPIIPPPQPNNTGRRDRRASSTSSSQPSRQRAMSVSATSPTTSVAGNSSVEGDDPTEAEGTVIAEEKRRRNTAASARFRIKKKQRTTNLERTVSDLSGRAEELEKEVTDLRRENSWLKEIVVLKGTRYAAAASTQQRMALSQAVKDAGIDLTVVGAGKASTSGASGSASGSTKEPQEISSDDDSDEDYAEVDKKGKGKKPAKESKMNLLAFTIHEFALIVFLSRRFVTHMDCTETCRVRTLGLCNQGFINTFYAFITPDETFSHGSPQPGTSIRALERKLLLMSFGRPPSINIGFTPTPPDRGSFPLDHYGECRDKMTLYMKCLKENSSNSTPCRALSRDYLDCRMQKGLMERDAWSNLGLQNVNGKNTEGSSDTAKKA
ncbi:Cytochrome c oxidase assembly protein COX19 [Leucoagaricus sp. SymC.cos]|nr:Cytochrome c oxidase assembly protein COX19 [Leucoagaricus sp. SymC.cos]